MFELWYNFRNWLAVKVRGYPEGSWSAVARQVAQEKVKEGITNYWFKLVPLIEKQVSEGQTYLVLPYDMRDTFSSPAGIKFLRGHNLRIVWQYPTSKTGTAYVVW